MKSDGDLFSAMQGHTFGAHVRVSSILYVNFLFYFSPLFCRIHVSSITFDFDSLLFLNGILISNECQTQHTL